MFLFLSILHTRNPWKNVALKRNAHPAKGVQVAGHKAISECRQRLQPAICTLAGCFNTTQHHKQHGQYARCVTCCGNAMLHVKSPRGWLHPAPGGASRPPEFLDGDSHLGGGGGRKGRWQMANLISLRAGRVKFKIGVRWCYPLALLCRRVAGVVSSMYPTPRATHTTQDRPPASLNTHIQQPPTARRSNSQCVAPSTNTDPTHCSTHLATTSQIKVEYKPLNRQPYVHTHAPKPLSLDQH